MIYPVRILLFCSVLWMAGCDQPAHRDNLNENQPEAISLLGKELYPNMPAESKRKHEQELEQAMSAYSTNPGKLENIIWLGRRTAYLMHYNESIRIYENGLKKFPDSYELLRHLGHRQITVRKFDEAIKNLTKAAALAEGKPMEIEPDGIPNKLNTPLGNIHFNIWYHLGLAHYLKGEFEEARSAYERCMEFSNNNDLLVATSDWLYMTLMKLGKRDEAARVLDSIKVGMKVIENESYYNRLMMYKGNLKPGDLLNKELISGSEDLELVLATQGYGVGNYHMMNGDTARSIEIFSEVVNGSYWPAFGYIASEAELARINTKN